MSAYLIGNLFGRLVVSYAIVWVIVWLLFSHRRWRDAFRNTHRWYGLTIVAVIFLLGVFVSASQGRIG